MSGLGRTLGERCRAGLLVWLTAACAATTPAAQHHGNNPTASAAPTTTLPDFGDAGMPLHLWEAGPAVKEAPRTTTRPYVPRP
jgi:hypothetical protein